MFEIKAAEARVIQLVPLVQTYFVLPKQKYIVAKDSVCVLIAQLTISLPIVTINYHD